MKTSKLRKKMCACGFPQSNPPHTHSITLVHDRRIASKKITHLRVGQGPCILCKHAVLRGKRNRYYACMKGGLRDRSAMCNIFCGGDDGEYSYTFYAFELDADLMKAVTLI